MNHRFTYKGRGHERLLAGVELDISKAACRERLFTLQCDWRQCDKADVEADFERTVALMTSRHYSPAIRTIAASFSVLVCCAAAAVLAS